MEIQIGPDWSRVVQDLLRIVFFGFFSFLNGFYWFFLGLDWFYWFLLVLHCVFMVWIGFWYYLQHFGTSGLVFIVFSLCFHGLDWFLLLFTTLWHIKIGFYWFFIVFCFVYCIFQWWILHFHFLFSVFCLMYMHDS